MDTGKRQAVWIALLSDYIIMAGCAFIGLPLMLFNLHRMIWIKTIKRALGLFIFVLSVSDCLQLSVQLLQVVRGLYNTNSVLIENECIFSAFVDLLTTMYRQISVILICIVLGRVYYHGPKDMPKSSVIKKSTIVFVITSTFIYSVCIASYKIYNIVRENTHVICELASLNANQYTNETFEALLHVQTQSIIEGFIWLLIICTLHVLSQSYTNKMEVKNSETNSDVEAAKLVIKHFVYCRLPYFATLCVYILLFEVGKISEKSFGIHTIICVAVYITSTLKFLNYFSNVFIIKSYKPYLGLQIPIITL